MGDVGENMGKNMGMEHIWILQESVGFYIDPIVIKKKTVGVLKTQTS